MLYWGIILFICIIVFVVSLRALTKSCWDSTLYLVSTLLTGVVAVIIALAMLLTTCEYRSFLASFETQRTIITQMSQSHQFNDNTLIYGDSITPQRCARIYQRLENNGFAINNVSLGVGSFSFMCLEEDGSFNPYTRDTFGIAVKATYAEDANGKPIMIYKQPKALSWKKSQKGCCRVALDGQSYEDELTWADHLGEDNLLQPVFRDGSMIKEDTLHDIRARLYKEGF